MKCFFERFKDKQEAERVAKTLIDAGYNAVLEQRFNINSEHEIWHVILNCAGSEDYNAAKLLFK